MNEQSFATRLKLLIRKINHARIDWGKMLLLRGTIFLARIFIRLSKQTRHQRRQRSCEFKYILIRLDGKLGDGVVATGLIHYLAQSAKESGQRILIIGDPIISALTTDLQNLVVWPYKKSLFLLIKYCWRLRAYEAEAVLNSSYILKPSHVWFGLFAASKNKVSFPIINEHIEDIWQGLPADLLKEHISKLYSQLALKVGLPEMKSYFYKLPYSKPKQRHGLCIGIWGAARHRTFSMAAVHWLIEQNKFSFSRIGFVAQGKQRHFLQRELAFPEIKTEKLTLEICPHDELENILAWINTFEKVISPDTAWVHVACALEIPVDAYYVTHSDNDMNNTQWAPLSKAPLRQFSIKAKEPHDLFLGIQPHHLMQAKLTASSS